MRILNALLFKMGRRVSLAKGENLGHSMSKAFSALMMFGAVSLLAACDTKQTAGPITSAPAAPTYIAKPRPPYGAVVGMYIPPRNAMGLRQTVNSDISPEQRLWNLRSGLNVAALNCQAAKHAPILDSYRVLLNRHKRELAKANAAIIAQYKQRHGEKEYRSALDSYMTQVYNYYALPPANRQFCDAALEVSLQLTPVAENALGGFSELALPKLERVFHDFYAAYEQYLIDLEQWNASGGLSTTNGVSTTTASSEMATPMGEETVANAAVVAEGSVVAETGEGVDGTGGLVVNETADTVVAAVAPVDSSVDSSAVSSVDASAVTPASEQAATTATNVAEAFGEGIAAREQATEAAVMSDTSHDPGVVGGVPAYGPVDETKLSDSKDEGNGE